jgi:hypothetical protein
MNKRGQFYLVAALVIILIMLGVTEIYNKVTSTNESDKAESLVREIGFEASKIIDNGAFLSLPKSNITANLNSTLEIYALNNPDTEIAFVYGNSSEIKFTQGFSVYYSLQKVNNGNQRVLKTLDLTSNMNLATIKLDENDTYVFNITNGQNFFLVTKIRRGDERIVATN